MKLAMIKFNHKSQLTSLRVYQTLHTLDDNLMNSKNISASPNHDMFDVMT